MGLLRERAKSATEEMDRPDADPAKLARTYAQFPVVNAFVSGWRDNYVHRIRPLLAPGRRTTLLDLGCGGGDIARSLARWAARDGLPLDVTAIDPDPRAMDFARAQQPVPGLHYRQAYSSELVAEGAVFDVVISNHVLHHLAPAELDGLFADSQQLARQLALHSDILRSAVAYALFSVATAPFFPGSFIRRDGLTSIRRSYTPAELVAVVPEGWQVERARPYRNLVLFTPGTHHV